MRILWAALALLFSLTAAHAQSAILQGGPWVPGHAPMYVGQGTSQAVVQDSGPAGGGAVGYGLGELLIVAQGTGTAPYAGQGTGPYGTNACDYDAPIFNPTGYHYLCLSANAQGGAVIAVGSGGGAAAQPLYFIVNGQTYQFPFSVGGIVGPPTTHAGDFAIWNNGTGTLLNDVTPAVFGETYTRTVWANDFGAVCNGSTDDHVAFQNTINEAQSLGLFASFNGSCFLSTGLSITAALNFGGVGTVQSQLVNNSGLNTITINTGAAVLLHDFAILYNSANSGDTAVTVGATGGANAISRFWNLEITGPNIGFNFTAAYEWVLRDSLIQGITSAGYGIVVNNTYNGDVGDSTITGNTIGGLSGAAAAIIWESSGGLRIENNKINGAGWSDGIQIYEAAGLATSDIFITGNSIEGFAATSNCILLQRQLGASLYHVVIANNECANPEVGVTVATDGSAWLNNVTISNNTIQTNNSSTTIAYEIASPILGLSIVGGTVLGNGSTNYIFDITGTQTSANCVVGPIAKNGTFGSSTVGSCTAISPD